ncbi:hypothetical protein [Vibrio hepatarius]|uniref:hypothetical protein n=1 Tax=Vibrio hepatarius TaxID=171383 RepID=UPI001C09701A|nr:hypothetical protein [Vibrio hepatarius]MBU2896187.1 hypothetical protein [Vibrio hepatarius]
MIQRFITSFCWIILVALALPSQALSYLTKDSNDAISRLIRNDFSNFNSQSLAQGLFEKSTKVAISHRPVSKSNVDSETLAIIQNNRLSSVTRDYAEGAVPFEDYTTDKIKTFTANSIHSEKIDNAWLCAEFNSQYRISGWKESNALYVALNSQFS